MIFNDQYFKQEYSSYKNYLELFSALSYLFSESDIPYLHYRIMENVFCNAFGAENLSRTDTAFDATKVVNNIKYGIGLKTFIAPLKKNGVAESKQEKIAEFNKEGINLNGLSIIDMTLKIAELRNARIHSAMKEYGIDKAIYHCALRYHEHDKDKSAKVLLKEFSYEPIDTSKIICTDKNYNPLSAQEMLKMPSDHLYFFEEDTDNFYSFHRSKSTLLKRFDTSLNNGIIIPVKKLTNPLEDLQKWFASVKLEDTSTPGVDHIILPLYSTKLRAKEKYVPEKSGLNQWKAAGRKRRFGEMYIPVPNFIRNACPGFFPPKDKDFILVTPDNKEIKVSLCQEDGKALMSNPNHALSQWFHPLLIKDTVESIVTYNDLSRIGKDSVRIEKISDLKYKFSLSTVGSWEDFKSKFEEKASTN